MSWTPEKIKQLKKLWAKGKSTVEIGRELGISKNAVVGKVHRLELDARPSPIKKATAPAPKPQKIKLSNNKGYMTLLDLKLNSCRWPIGEPKDADFHFCGKDTVTGKPYCAEHCKVAYTSLKELANQNKNDAKKENKQEVIEDAEFEEIDTTADSQAEKLKTSNIKHVSEKEEKTSNSTKKEGENKTSKETVASKKSSEKTPAKSVKKTTVADKQEKVTVTKSFAPKTGASNVTSSKAVKKILDKEMVPTSSKKQTSVKPASKNATKTLKEPKEDDKATPVASILKRVVNAAKSKRK